MADLCGRIEQMHINVMHLLGGLPKSRRLVWFFAKEGCKVFWLYVSSLFVGFSLLLSNVQVQDWQCERCVLVASAKEVSEHVQNFAQLQSLLKYHQLSDYQIVKVLAVIRENLSNIALQEAHVNLDLVNSGVSPQLHSLFVQAKDFGFLIDSDLMFHFTIHSKIRAMECAGNWNKIYADHNLPVSVRNQCRAWSQKFKDLDAGRKMTVVYRSPGPDAKDYQLLLMAQKKDGVWNGILQDKDVLVPLSRTIVEQFTHPLPNAPVSSGYGKRVTPYTGIHTGIDLAAATGTPVQSATAGVVVEARAMNGYGNTVIVQNGKIRTLYAHLSKMDVCVGEQLEAGKTIGKVGSTGRATGPHLHFEVRINDLHVDPTPYLLKSKSSGIDHQKRAGELIQSAV